MPTIRIIDGKVEVIDGERVVTSEGDRVVDGTGTGGAANLIAEDVSGVVIQSGGEIPLTEPASAEDTEAEIAEAVEAFARQRQRGVGHKSIRAHNVVTGRVSDDARVIQRETIESIEIGGNEVTVDGENVTDKRKESYGYGIGLD